MASITNAFLNITYDKFKIDRRIQTEINIALSNANRWAHRGANHLHLHDAGKCNETHHRTMAEDCFDNARYQCLMAYTMVKTVFLQTSDDIHVPVSAWYELLDFIQDMLIECMDMANRSILGETMSKEEFMKDWSYDPNYN